MARAFTTLDGLVAPLDRSNVDTDAILPKQFMKSIQRTGFGPHLFDEWRYLDHGEPGQGGAARVGVDEFLSANADVEVLVARGLICACQRVRKGESVPMLNYRDRADNESKTDYLNFDETAGQIARLVRDPKLLPVAVGIFGGWGAGKSTMLNLTEAALLAAPLCVSYEGRDDRAVPGSRPSQIADGPFDLLRQMEAKESAMRTMLPVLDSSCRTACCR